MNTWLDILDALGASRYMAHSLCLTSDPLIMILYVMADFSTFAAYFVIGLTLLYVARSVTRGRVPDFNYRPMTIYLFGAFIFLCGLSHLTMVLTLFSGVYRLDVFIRAAMAAVSVTTALVVVNDFILVRWTREK